jgi:hypothetical protein
MVEHERLARRRVEDERRTHEPLPEHALLALQRSAGNQAVRRMLQRQFDPEFIYGAGDQGIEKTTISTQDDMNREVERVIEDRFGDYRELFTKNTFATSAAAWRDLIFDFMSEVFVFDGVGKPEMLAAVRWVKDKYRSESLLNAARVHVYWTEDGPPWSVENLKQRMSDAGAYLDDRDDDALDRIFETEGKFAKKKVSFPSTNLELLDEDEVVVLIDDHQNKHQNSKIAQFKSYTGEPGSKFAVGKDLEWHRGHTALVVKATVEEAVQSELVTPATDYTPSKDPIDGIVYDLRISYDDDTGKYVGSYHCNPVVAEY